MLAALVLSVVALAQRATGASAPAPVQPATAAQPAPTPRRASAYVPPRVLGTQPDLQGIWQVMNTAAWDIQDHGAERYPGLPARFSVPAGPGVVDGNELPYQPSALAKKQENFRNRATADPEAQCYLPGVPRITYMPHPFQIFQFPDRVLILYEYLHATREIPIDGSRHPTIPVEFWMGDSRGRFDADSLVVDVTLFTTETWFDRAGNFHSDALHVVERYTRTSPDLMQYRATIEDPTVFTRPWTMTMPLYRRTDPRAEILEFVCYALAREEANGAP